MFSEPLTIDELTNARSSLESALAQAQDDNQDAPEDRQLAPAYESQTLTIFLWCFSLCHSGGVDPKLIYT